MVENTSKKISDSKVSYVSMQSLIRGFKANSKFLSSFEVSERFYFHLSSLVMELVQRGSSDRLKTSLNLKPYI